MYTVPVTRVSNPMATHHESGMLLPARPRRSNTSQTSRTNSQERSAAWERSAAFPGQNAKLKKAQSQHEDTQIRNSVSFHYSGESPAAIVSTSANIEARQTPQVYRRNTVSYIHYLQRRIKGITSKVDSYTHDLKKEIKLFNSKISSYGHDLDRKMQILCANKDSLGDVVKEIQWLQRKQESHAHDLDKNLKQLKNSHEHILILIESLNAIKDSFVNFFTTQMEKLKAVSDLDRKIEIEALLKESYDLDLQRCNEMLDMINSRSDDVDKLIQHVNAKKDEHDEDFNREIQLLSARKILSAHKLVLQFKLLLVKRSSYAIDLGKRYISCYEKHISRDHDIEREYKLLHSNLGPFAHDLDSQIKMLDLKLDSLGHDIRMQENQLDSCENSYLVDIDQKMKLLNSEMAPYLGTGIQLLNSDMAPYLGREISLQN